MTLQGKYKLKGNLQLSGDKSISHRALIIGSLSIGETKIYNLLESKDIQSTINILKELGIKIIKKNNYWLVNGNGTGGFKQPNSALDAGNSGTTSRLIFGIVATMPIYCTFIGDSSLSKRPMSRVTNFLVNFGAKVTLTNKDYLPLSIHGTSEAIPLRHNITKPSAQIKSSLMLAALNIHGKTTITEKQPTRNHTEILFKYLNIKFSEKKLKNGANQIALKGPCEIKSKDIYVASDPSSASFFVVAALILPGSNITLNNICLNKTRIAYLDVLKKMGGKIKVTKVKKLSGEQIGSINVKSSNLKCIKIKKESSPYLIDEFPILAIAATQALGTTIMEGLGELRFKESDRLNGIYVNLKNSGISSKIVKDNLYITGNKKIIEGGNKIDSFGDHRIAMAFNVLNLLSKKKLVINNLKCISISYPNFHKDLKKLTINA